MTLHDAAAPPAESEPPRDPGSVGRVRAWARRHSPGRLLLEAALIVLSVLLGFAVNAWQQRQSERELAERVVANFRREMQENLATLQRSYPLHRDFAARLRAAAAREHPDSSAFEVFASLMPRDGLALAPLKEAAWETAQSTGALRLLDYHVASQLSETYVIQRGTLMQTQRLLTERFLAPPNFDPAQQKTMLMTSYMLMVELSGQEAYLVEVYQKTLRQLAASPGRAAR
jgi:type II secretory pathway pseudopilin PulG